MTAAAPPLAAPLPSPLPTRAGRAWLFASILLAVACLPYLPSLHAPFVFDDHDAILGNRSIRSLATALKPDPGQPTLRRPVINLSLALNYAISGDRPWSYRLVNVAAHGVNALLLWLWLRALGSVGWRLGGQAPPAFPLALLWAAHPLHTEAVAYITQRTETFAVMAILFTLWAAANSQRSRQPRRWRAAALAACLVGVGCKEIIYAAPPLVALQGWLLREEPGHPASRGRGLFLAALFATWVPLGFLIARGGGGDGIGTEGGVTSWRYLCTQAGVILHYLRLSVWPHPLSISHAWPISDGLARAWPQALAVVAALAGAGGLLIRRRGLALPAWAFFLVLAPTSSVVPIYTEVAAERRTYLPLAALLWVAWAIARPVVSQPGRWSRGLRTGLLAVALVFMVLGTLNRLRDYETEEGLWRSALAVNGRNPTALNNLAATLHGLSKAQPDRRPSLLAQAVTLYERSAELRPRSSTWRNLGLSYAALGRHEDAVRAYASAWDPQAPSAALLNDWGNALARLNRFEEAWKAYQKAMELDPRRPDTHANLGAALLAAGRPAQALEALERALALNPLDPQARRNLASALLATGRELDRAERVLSEWLALRPRDAVATLQRGEARLALGRAGEAEADARRAIELLREPAAAHLLLSRCRMAQGDRESALREAQRAIELAPANERFQRWARELREAP